VADENVVSDSSRGPKIRHVLALPENSDFAGVAAGGAACGAVVIPFVTAVLRQIGIGSVVGDARPDGRIDIDLVAAAALGTA